MCNKNATTVHKPQVKAHCRPQSHTEKTICPPAALAIPSADLGIYHRTGTLSGFHLIHTKILYQICRDIFNQGLLQCGNGLLATRKGILWTIDLSKSAGVGCECLRIPITFSLLPLLLCRT